MRRPTLLLTLVSLLLLVGACGEESTNLTQPDQMSPAAGGEYFVTENGWAPTPLSTLETLEYEEISGTIHPGLGGFLFGTLQTWPGTCTFAIQVPPEALPGDPNESVPFSIRVPTYDSYMANKGANGGKGLPLIMEMEPSHLNFLVPVTVYATYMPWVNTKEWSEDVEDWDLWTGEPEVDMESFGFKLITITKKKVTVSFEAPHFSRWEGGGGGPPGL